MKKPIGLIGNPLIFLSIFFLATLLVFGKSDMTFATSSIPSNNSIATVVECLKLKVPIEDRDAWLIAEKKSWEPWLEGKEGFLSRQLLWDRQREEATVLITWASRKSWKSISKAEINQVQLLFEGFAREETGKELDNPFPIQFEAELSPQL
ncbi:MULTISPECIES: TIGR03792 family protein [Prochlorococcus]|uniref:TIGR03792 family protein n=1 Tax=Prochlorococcus TaxID=1218 RepID=UPI000533952C|nr:MULTISPECIES: TIGR03792 family protein [Prochlorococcus]KGG12010.1 hypothetical protein EV05_1213 [Prochlorococcus sp. MIT 0601]